MAKDPQPDQLAFDAETMRVLERYGFDRAAFGRLRGAVQRGDIGSAFNVVRGVVEPTRPEDIVALPDEGSPERARLERLGREAIRRGEVGIVVLAGGMATRFGGVVKAAVEAVDGRSFAAVKVADAALAARQNEGRVPVYLMASFATEADVRKLGEALATPHAPVNTFAQSVSVRLTPTGEVFTDEDGRPSLYAPGHGDTTFALRRAGLLDQFRSAGGKHLLVSNVDNVAATVDPAVIGAHVAGAKALTAEVVQHEAGDRGGRPARLDGRLVMLEAFRFPPGFDQASIPVFNTNTFVLDAAAVERDFDLTWFAVAKDVSGRQALQFERLLGELTSFLPSQFLKVPRHGVEGRFQPAKDPEEHQRRLPEIRAILRARGLL